MAGPPGLPPATLVTDTGSRPRRTRVLVAVGAAVVLVAAAVVATVLATRGSDPGTSVVAAPTTVPTTAPTSAPSFAPDSPQVRYVDRLCASGDLLVSLGATTISPEPTGDPVVARRDYLTAVDRVGGIVDTALADFTALRDDAPDEATRLAFGQVVEEFTSAREAFDEGREVVAAADPLTVEAYSVGIDRFTDGTRNMALAATIMQGVQLPEGFAGAHAAAPHCTD